MPLPSEFATTPQPGPPQSAPQPGPPQSFKRAVKSLLLLLLTPLKPAARLVRRFLLAPIEAQITNLHARTNLLFNELQAIQDRVQAVQDRIDNQIELRI